jgi:hypothetical protein
MLAHWNPVGLDAIILKPKHVSTEKETARTLRPLRTDRA